MERGGDRKQDFLGQGEPQDLSRPIIPTGSRRAQERLFAHDWLREARSQNSTLREQYLPDAIEDSHETYMRSIERIQPSGLRRQNPTRGFQARRRG